MTFASRRNRRASSLDSKEDPSWPEKQRGAIAIKMLARQAVIIWRISMFGFIFL
jgi:hypothetical protein